MKHDQPCSALILAGGLGTRLQSALPGVPKVLAPVQGRPFITYLLDQLARADFQHVILLTGHQSDHVQRTLGSQHAGMSLEYSSESKALGTGGALRHAIHLAKGDTILLMNGDSTCGVDLASFREEHHQRDADASLVLTHVEDVSRFGQVQTDDEGNVTGFVEKQQSRGPGWINAGVYLLSKKLVQEIRPGIAMSLERDLMPEWLKTGRVVGFRSAGRFLDIGVPGSYAQAADYLGADAGKPCLNQN